MTRKKDAVLLQPHYTILYYIILYYTILYYTILYDTILYYTILHYTMLYKSYKNSPRTPQRFRVHGALLAGARVGTPEPLRASAVGAKPRVSSGDLGLSGIRVAARSELGGANAVPQTAQNGRYWSFCA